MSRVAHVLTDYRRSLALFSREIRLFLVTAVLVGFAWDGIRAVLFNLFLLRLGYGPEFVGLVTAAAALSFAVSSPLAGVLGNRWGSRNSLVIGSVLAAAGLLLVPLVDSLPTVWWAPWLVATAVLGQFGQALYFVNALPYTMNATGAAERAHLFSFHIAIGPLAAFAGSLVGGALPGVFAGMLGLSLQDAAAYRYPLWLAGLLLVPAALVLLPARVTDPAPEPRPDDAPDKAPIRLIVLFGLMMALRFAGRVTINTFFNVYLDQALQTPTALIGALTAAGQLLSVPAALASPDLVARLGYRRTISRGMLAMAASVLPMALIPHWLAAGAGFVGASAFFTGTISPMRLYSQESVAPRWRAAMAAAFMTGAGVAWTAASLAAGYAIGWIGYQALFLAGAGLSAVSGLGFDLFFRGRETDV